MYAIIMAIVVTILIIVIGIKLDNPDNIPLKNRIRNIKKYTATIIIFAFTSIVVFLFIYNLDFFKKIILEDQSDIYDTMILIVLSMAISLNIDGVFVAIIQNLYEKIVIDKYEKKYENYDYKYYREIIKETSPAILSYCYNRKINFEDEVIATILNLQNKRIVEIKNDCINIIGDTNKLKKHEKFILDEINGSNINKYSKKEFIKVLISDMEKEGYIYLEKSNKLNITYIMEYFMLWIIFYSLTTIVFYYEKIQLGPFMFLAYFLTFVSVPIYKKIQAKINPILRKDKALELSGKLKGLKNYINDYSMIKDYGVENINLYDEYVIYAVIFNIRGKLNTECKKIYDNIKIISINKEQ